MKTPFIIISAELSKLNTTENMNRTKQLQAELTRQGFTYKEVLGLYAGKPETSFLINLDTLYTARKTTIEAVQAIASNFDQESVLVRNCDNSCQLLFESGDEIGVGAWKSVDKMPIDFGTYDPSTKQYYTTTGVA